MKKILLLISLLAIVRLASAQDEAIFSHYNIMPVLINPSAAGFGDVHQFQLNARAQWSGFVDAPTTYSAQYNGPLGNNFGLGVGILTESAAQMNRLRAHLNYAFRFNISEVVKLSAGFSTEYQQVRLDNGIAANIFFQEGDKVIEDFMDGRGVFDASLGFFSSFNEDTKVGLTFTNLVRSRISNIGAQGNEESILSYYIFYASHKLRMDDLNFTLEPSFLVRNVRDVPSQVDINLKASFLEESLTTGLSYRSLGSLGILLGTRLSSFEFYYSYDVFFQNFQKYNDGSHEVTIALSFNRTKQQGPAGKRY
ncbi:MAG: PorP/SprF family type IX secretion system membrane protein [Lewinellaceae bacterium]|nr:PorP/SprF family type IX secretion system membrane protein [Phaeodactylibacter sp.]MCB0634859.1 PorP/SprF family type IX secretion system membrane protein [Lewinella sp.]MCB9346517.1 PorP/SprF family type IX secretion system membrane protein [Lewinellaceae bacterium]